MTVGVVAGPLTRFSHQQVDGIGVFDPVPCWLNGPKFLVSHQQEAVGTDGGNYVPSYLGVRPVTVNADLSVSWGDWVSLGIEVQNGTEYLFRIDGTRALLLFETVGPTPTMQCVIVTYDGASLSYGSVHSLAGYIDGYSFSDNVLTAAMARPNVLVFGHATAYFGGTYGHLYSFLINPDADTVTFVNDIAPDPLMAQGGVTSPVYDYLYSHRLTKISDGHLAHTWNIGHYPPGVGCRTGVRPVTVSTAGVLVGGDSAEGGAEIPGSTTYITAQATVDVSETRLVVFANYPSSGPNGVGVFDMALTFDWATPSVAIGPAVQLGDDLSQGPDHPYTGSGYLRMGTDDLWAVLMRNDDGNAQYPSVNLYEFGDASITLVSSNVLQDAPTLSPDDWGFLGAISIDAGPVYGLIAVPTFEYHEHDYPTDDVEDRLYQGYVQAFQFPNGTSALVGKRVHFRGTG